MSCTVIALYPYKYELGDGKEVSFEIGEQFVLLSKTNADWWRVQKDGEKPIYVPASYVQEIQDDDHRINLSPTAETPPRTYARCESKNSDEEYDKRSDSPMIADCPVVSVFEDGEANNSYDDSEQFELPHRPKSVSGVRGIAKSLEMTGHPVRGGSLSLPHASRPKSQSLPPGWVGKKDESSGRMYYVNTNTHETSWKPPRNQRSRTAPSWVQTPTLGWYISDDCPLNELVYVNDYNDEQWQLTTDDQGRPFYYQVNGTVTAWELPQVGRGHERKQSTQSMDSLSSGGADEWPAPPGPAEMQSVQSVERQGILNRKKLTESGGKKAKQPQQWKSSWTSTFVMLLSSNMVFYKDQKAAASKPGHPHGKPESSCELQGADLKWLTSGSGSSKKRKNVFQIRTVSGMTCLLQSDNSSEATGWFDAIGGVIRRLNDEDSTIIGTVQEKGQAALPGYESDDALDEPATPTQLSPAPMFTRKKVPAKPSLDKDDNKSKIRDKLLKFLTKRPMMEELEKKGILKECVFGSHLSTLCEREKSSVPNFVVMCIEAIEKKGLHYDGIYRVCGNASTVQKIRVTIDQEEKISLGTPPFDEVHALTGALKLFFRELQEPLIPFDFFSGFVEAIKQKTLKDKLGAFKTLSAQLPKVNSNTLKLLMRHLRRVMDDSEKNRMHAQNLAIVWGPNLMWPKYEAGNIAIQMVHQNQITEFLLLEMDSVLK